jgi:hypothetical protein
MPQHLPLLNYMQELYSCTKEFMPFLDDDLAFWCIAGKLLDVSSSYE